MLKHDKNLQVKPKKQAKKESIGNSDFVFEDINFEKLKKIKPNNAYLTQKKNYYELYNDVNIEEITLDFTDFYNNYKEYLDRKKYFFNIKF